MKDCFPKGRALPSDDVTRVWQAKPSGRRIQYPLEDVVEWTWSERLPGDAKLLLLSIALSGFDSDEARLNTGMTSNRYRRTRMGLLESGHLEALLEARQSQEKLQ